MTEMLPRGEMAGWLSMRTRALIELALATPVCVWAAWPFYVRTVQSVVNRRLNMFTLIGLGVSVAYVYSVLAALLPGVFPSAFRSPSGDVDGYFEAAAVIVMLILLGLVLELRAGLLPYGDRLPADHRLVNAAGTFQDHAVDRNLLARADAQSIARLNVFEWQRSRAPIQKLADLVSSYFVPAVILIAIVTFGFGAPSDLRMAHALIGAVAVLIIACPCALGLATPMSIMVATGKGASMGVLFRNAEAIDELRKVDTLVVDKTGTLTEGKPALGSVVPVADGGEVELLRLAAALERGSEHPLAASIVKGAEDQHVPEVNAALFQSVTGKGVTGQVDGRAVALGNRALMESLHVDVSSLAARADELRQDGQTVMFVTIDGRPAGLLGVADPIKESTPAAIRTLHDEGVRIVMVTGDNAVTAQAVARNLGIDQVMADVLPDQKAEK
jgi:cation transport ATPase